MRRILILGISAALLLLLAAPALAQGPSNAKFRPLLVSVSANAAVFAPKTEILFDGEKINGLMGFNYKVYKDRQDVRGIGINNGTVYGRLHVEGKILVHSNSELLNKHMDNNTHFQIILSAMRDSYPEGLSIKTFRFQKCQIDAIHSLTNPEGEREFRIYSFTCQGVSGMIPTGEGMITPGYLNTNWALDENGESLNTVVMVTDGAEVTQTSVEESTFTEALTYQLESRGYDLDTYTFTADRIREA